MTYTEWRDELKNNLLTVTDAERRRVLDYYAEAYADRREAGFSEREIIEDFGAPYDAAQRILAEDFGEDYREVHRETGSFKEKHHTHDTRDSYREEPLREEKRSEPKPKKSHGDYTWVFVLLCVIFAVPLFGLVMAMVGVTVGLCVAPFSIVISGAGSIVAGIAALFTNALEGVISIGTGFVVLGIGIALFPLFFKLVKWMWKLFNMFFRWLKGLFSGKERA